MVKKTKTPEIGGELYIPELALDSMKIHLSGITVRVLKYNENSILVDLSHVPLAKEDARRRVRKGHISKKQMLELNGRAVISMRAVGIDPTTVRGRQIIAGTVTHEAQRKARVKAQAKAGELSHKRATALAAERKDFGVKLQDYYDQGYSRTRVSKMTHRSINFIMRVEQEYGLTPPQIYKIQVSLVDGRKRYFKSRADMVRELKLPDIYKSSSKTTDVAGNRYESGLWMQAKDRVVPAQTWQ